MAIGLVSVETSVSFFGEPLFFLASSVFSPSSKLSSLYSNVSLALLLKLHSQVQGKISLSCRVSARRGCVSTRWACGAIGERERRLEFFGQLVINWPFTTI